MGFASAGLGRIAGTGGCQRAWLCPADGRARPKSVSSRQGAPGRSRRLRSGERERRIGCAPCAASRRPAEAVYTPFWKAVWLRWGFRQGWNPGLGRGAFRHDSHDEGDFPNAESRGSCAPPRQGVTGKARSPKRSRVDGASGRQTGRRNAQPLRVIDPPFGAAEAPLNNNPCARAIKMAILERGAAWPGGFFQGFRGVLQGDG